MLWLQKKSLCSCIVICTAYNTKLCSNFYEISSKASSFQKRKVSFCDNSSNILLFHIMVLQSGCQRRFKNSLSMDGNGRQILLPFSNSCNKVVNKYGNKLMNVLLRGAFYRKRNTGDHCK